MNRLSPAEGLLRTFQFPRARICETRYSPGARLARHEHGPLTLSIMFYGGYLEQYGRRESWVSRDDLLVKPAGVSHANLFGSEGAWGILVEIDEDGIADDWQWKPPGDPVLRTDPGVLPLGLELRRRAQNGESLAVQSLVAELLGRVGPEAAESRAPVWMNRVDQRLREEPEQRFTLSDLAENVGVHPVHLAQSWRRWYGTTLGARRRALRFSRAALEVVRRSDSLANVATACGYADQSHLTREFRRMATVTPQQFRRKTPAS